MKGAKLTLAFSVVALAASFAPAVGQPQTAPPAKAKGAQFAWPERMKNAQVLPADIGADRLRDAMRHFAMALGVRCAFCHVGPEGAPLDQLDFASDDNPHKNVARGMMLMSASLNEQSLPAFEGLDAPQVTCFTCHRGSTEPALQPTEPVPAATQSQPRPRV